jgi:branched-chain amino acid transport system ATP-binding protein
MGWFHYFPGEGNDWKKRMTEPLLQLKDLSRHFGGVAAVEGVDVEFGKGAITGLIGPNGAGKTTLLQLISGVQMPSRGKIIFKGDDITRTRTHERARLGIGRAFQIVQPLTGMNVAENVTTAALFGRSGAKRSVREARDFGLDILNRVGLFAKRENYMSALTLADSKRLELARALATEPELLLLDEVMAGLNQSEVAMQTDLLRSVNAAGLTMIVVEHVMKAIMAISDVILVLHHGRKIEFAPPDEVTKNPEVIRAYLGARYAEPV